MTQPQQMKIDDAAFREFGNLFPHGIPSKYLDQTLAAWIDALNRGFEAQEMIDAYRLNVASHERQPNRYPEAYSYAHAWLSSPTGLNRWCSVLRQQRATKQALARTGGRTYPYLDGDSLVMADGSKMPGHAATKIVHRGIEVALSPDGSGYVADIPGFGLSPIPGTEPGSMSDSALRQKVDRHLAELGVVSREFDPSEVPDPSLKTAWELACSEVSNPAHKAILECLSPRLREDMSIELLTSLSAVKELIRRTIAQEDVAGVLSKIFGQAAFKVKIVDAFSVTAPGNWKHAGQGPSDVVPSQQTANAPSHINTGAPSRSRR